MSRIKDMTGYEFQTWKVKSLSSKKSSGNNVYWLCECQSCGAQKELCGSEIRLNRTGMCKCQKQQNQKPKDKYYNAETSTSCKIKDEIGNRYGKLLVVSFAYTKNANAYWNCQCDCGKTTIVRGNALRTGSTCSCGCQTSRKEEEIVKILDKNCIKYKREYIFPDLKDSGFLRFDFAIMQNNTIRGLIEYQGSQHYETIGLFSKDGLLQTHDNMKREYCKLHNIPLLELNKENKLEQDILSWLNKIGE